MTPKISLIGAGSVVFAKTLISDIWRFPELANATICLMDIDPARLKVADIMMRRIAKKLDVGAKIESTLDQREAITGAKYVICTVQVGGYKPSTVRDFKIPAKYGLQQTIADTLGVGGVFRALRTIPVINSIARDIADYAHPNCLFLNYTNPMAMNCWAVEEAVGIPHVGLCHSVFGTANQLCNFAKLPPEDVDYLVAGINHMAFFLKFQYRGQDAYPLLFKALENSERRQELVRFEMMRRTGYFVTESSEHQSEYVPYFIHHGQKVIDQFNIPIDEYIRRCEAIIGSWEETEAELLGKDGEIEIKPQSHEYGSYIIHSIESGQPRTVYGNVPNRDIITNLPNRCNVEVPCLVDRNGLQPVTVGELPPQLAALCMTNINVQELAVKAALTGKREHIYHAVMLDPHASATLPLDKIWAMCDELIEAHQKDGFLGEFTPTLKNTGRGYAGVGDRIIARLEGQGVFATDAGAQNRLRLTVENPTGQAVTLQFQLRPESDALTLEGDGILTVKAPAKGSATAEAVTINQSAIDDNLSVTLETECANVLAVSAVLRPRPKLGLNDSGEATFGLKLAGFDAAEGTLARDGDLIRLRAKVLDSDLKPNYDSPFAGSGLQLFFAPLDNTGNIREVNIIADPAGKAEVRLFKNPLDNAKITFRRTDIYYELEFTVSFEELGLEPTNEVLFDCIANLGALGDAHSGGRTVLSGNFNAFSNSSQYTLVSWAQRTQ
ncbi:alpha-glucosidase/alpha-galactosidase [Coraliomargarita parva]|uniref:alpha-glucosidase/alpha-galactosidase n=1 Tax=Coraliomargarita parva TaxID=3014050 RepID=UPI0022B5861C|nr:alpha-glucosidase/alpha-galactosidase [Coraliomargarita parva]